MRLKLKENHILTIRSAVVTAFILISALLGVVFMGKAYSVIRKTAFGETTAFFDMTETDVYTFFGHEFHFPLIRYTQKIVVLCKYYSSGLIKLLNYAFYVIKESWRYIILLF